MEVRADTAVRMAVRADTAEKGVKAERAALGEKVNTQDFLETAGKTETEKGLKDMENTAAEVEETRDGMAAASEVDTRENVGHVTKPGTNQPNVTV